MLHVSTTVERASGRRQCPLTRHLPKYSRVILFARVSLHHPRKSRDARTMRTRRAVLHKTSPRSLWIVSPSQFTQRHWHLLLRRGRNRHVSRMLSRAKIIARNRKPYETVAYLRKRDKILRWMWRSVVSSFVCTVSTYPVLNFSSMSL